MKQIDLLLALQAQADPPPTFPETHKHKNHQIPQESEQLSHGLIHKYIHMQRSHIIQTHSEAHPWSTPTELW